MNFPSKDGLLAAILLHPRQQGAHHYSFLDDKTQYDYGGYHRVLLSLSPYQSANSLDKTQYRATLPILLKVLMVRDHLDLTY